jgi:3-hydroxyacyl-[acyl-carrier-protein] dehydratase
MVERYSSAKEIITQGEIVMKLDQEQIELFLPHGPSFRFIDQVHSITFDDSSKNDTSKVIESEQDLVGGTVHASFNVREDLDVLAGHFPGNPIMPGVIQVEMMAQAASFLYTRMTSKSFDEFDLDVALLGVEKARFRKPITPTMTIDIYAKLTRIRSWLKSYSCEIRHAGQTVASADIIATIKLV